MNKVITGHKHKGPGRIIYNDDNRTIAEWAEHYKCREGYIRDRVRLLGIEKAFEQLDRRLGKIMNPPVIKREWVYIPPVQSLI